MHLTYHHDKSHGDHASTDDSVEAGAPGDEIAITPAMIKAGAAVLCSFETFTADEAYWAQEVYSAMRRVALSSRRDIAP